MIPMDQKTEQELDEVIKEARALRFSAARLRAARLAAFPNISLRQFAPNILGISPQRLSQYERGQIEPSATLLAQLCRIYDTDLLSLTENSTEKIWACRQ